MSENEKEELLLQIEEAREKLREIARYFAARDKNESVPD